MNLAARHSEIKLCKIFHLSTASVFYSGDVFQKPTLLWRNYRWSSGAHFALPVAGGVAFLHMCEEKEEEEDEGEERGGGQACQLRIQDTEHSH